MRVGTDDAEAGAIVLGWLTKLAATLALLGLLAFDGISLVKATFTAADDASSAANVAAAAYADTKDAQEAYDAAVASVAAQAETIDPKSFSVDTANGHVTLKVTQEATTVWLHKVGPLKKYAFVTQQGEGAPPS